MNYIFKKLIFYEFLKIFEKKFILNFLTFFSFSLLHSFSLLLFFKFCKISKANWWVVSNGSDQPTTSRNINFTDTKLFTIIVSSNQVDLMRIYLQLKDPSILTSYIDFIIFGNHRFDRRPYSNDSIATVFKIVFLVDLDYWVWGRN